MTGNPRVAHGSGAIACSATRKNGQGLVEFALILPVLAILLFGIVQAGITFGAYNGLINAVRDSARYGSVCSGALDCGQQTADHLIAGIGSGVFAYTPGSDHSQVTYSTYQDAGGLWNIQIHVTGCVQGLIFVPFVGSLFGWNGGVPLQSTEIFRVEGQPSTVSPPTPTPGSDGTCH